MHICVYCSASENLAAHYTAAADAFGRAIGSRGHTLVYGGATRGLMGIVARGVHAAGGKVIGYIPKILMHVEFAYENADELFLTEDMRERKAGMAGRADAFAALPGGIGTLEELFEIMTLRALNQTTRPLVLINTSGFYDPLAALIQRMADEGFIRRPLDEIYALTADVDTAISLLEASAPSPG